MIKNALANYERGSLAWRVLKSLSNCVGYERRATKRDLFWSIQMEDRAIRATINDLRKAGIPICSTAADGGGYWIAASVDELEDFLTQEYRSKIKDMREVVHALETSRWFPDNPQMTLGI